MTGKITVGTIQDTDGNTVASTYVTNGVAKAWVKYNQITPGIDNSLNVSSVADTATAVYTITYASNWANINYISVTGGSINGSDGAGGSAFGPRHQTPTTSSLAVVSTYGQQGNSALDWGSNETSHNGDLA